MFFNEEEKTYSKKDGKKTSIVSQAVKATRHRMAELVRTKVTHLIPDIYLRIFTTYMDVTITPGVMMGIRSWS